MTHSNENPGQGPVTQLIYVSSLAGAGEPELAGILESSHRRNRQDDITGMLLYSGGNFLQVLEGPKERVHGAYERISQDPRHRNLMLLSEEEVAERHFPNWRMGYRQLGAEEVARFPAQAPYFRFGFDAKGFQAKPGAALELLELFSRDMA